MNKSYRKLIVPTLAAFVLGSTYSVSYSQQVSRNYGEITTCQDSSQVRKKLPKPSLDNLVGEFEIPFMLDDPAITPSHVIEKSYLIKAYYTKSGKNVKQSKFRKLLARGNFDIIEVYELDDSGNTIGRPSATIFKNPKTYIFYDLRDDAPTSSQPDLMTCTDWSPNLVNGVLYKITRLRAIERQMLEPPTEFNM